MEPYRGLYLHVQFSLFVHHTTGNMDPLPVAFKCAELQSISVGIFVTKYSFYSKMCITLL